MKETFDEVKHIREAVYVEKQLYLFTVNQSYCDISEAGGTLLSLSVNVLSIF